MTIGAYISDAPKDITGAVVRKGGALKTITEGWARTGGSIKQFYAVLKVGLSTFAAIGRGNSATVVTVTSQSVTAGVQGAVGTVSYAWTRTAPDGHAWTIDNPTGQTTTFSTLADQGESWTATFICTVTDQAGQVLASPTLTVNNANIYYGGGYIGSGAPVGGGEYP